MNEKNEIRNKPGVLREEKARGPAPPKDSNPPSPRQRRLLEQFRILQEMVYSERARPPRRDLLQVEGNVLPVVDPGPKDFELVGIGISPQQFSETLIALANFCRACGGIGLGIGTFGVISDEE